MLPETPARFLVVTAIVAACSAAGTSPVFAQSTGQSRPYRGLFGSAVSDQALGQRLGFTVAVAEAYDDDVLADLQPGINPTVDQTAGYFTMLLANAEYKRRSRRVDFGLTTASALRYYGDIEQVRSVSHSASVGVSARLSGTTTLTAHQNAAYSPSYFFGLFPSYSDASNPGDVIPAAPDYAVSEFESYSHRTSATLSYRLADAGRLSSTGAFHYTDYLHESALRRDRTSSSIRGQYSHRLARNTTMSTGYRYQTGDLAYGLGTKTAEHEVDFGMTYSRALSISRRASFGFRAGVSTVDVPVSEIAPAATPLQGRLYRMSGNLHVGYEFKLGWEARATYRRGLEYIPDLTEPVYTDGVTVGLEGLITRRLDIRASASYSKGESLVNRSASKFDTYTSNTRISYALTSGLALFGEYLYYYYDFRGSSLLSPGIPASLERNGIRVGLMLWVPALPR